MDLLVEAAYHILIVVDSLSVLRQAGLARLLLKLGQNDLLALLELLLAGEDVHRQLLKILLVEVVHLVKGGYVLQKGDLVLLKLVADLVHVDLGLVVLGLHHGDLVFGLLEETEEALLLLLAVVEALELNDEVREHAADLAHVLRADAVQRGAGEIGDVLLAGGAVLQYGVGIGDVYFFRKIVYKLQLLGGKLGFLSLSGGHRGSLLLGDSLSGGGLCGGSRRRGLKGQGGDVIKIYIGHFRSFLSLCYFVMLLSDTILLSPPGKVKNNLTFAQRCAAFAALR